jgi:glycosyltransferase involved in cell wall biosynthesis
MRHYAEFLSKRGVECAHIPIGAYREPEMLPESESQELLFFTTLAPFKGLELLLEALHILRSEFPRLKLTIAGAEHTRFPNYLRDLEARFDRSNGTHWLGQVVEDDVKELFRQAQVVVLPYTASTGSSSVLYQAATWGRAVVMSDLKEMRALIDENDLHVEFFKSGEVPSLCNSIRSLLKSPERRRSQALHNINIIKRAPPEETCRKYLKAFNRALEKRGSSKRIAPAFENETA